MEIKQYGIYWVNLDPTSGSEVNKTRPCVVVSPDEMNIFLKTVIIAPLTHTVKPYPTRIDCVVKGEKGSIMLDQIRTIDKSRIVGSIGSLHLREIKTVKVVLNELFC